MSDKTPILYDLITTHGLTLSPWCWHAKMALAHKGITAERRELRFTQKQELADNGGKTFPLLVDADGSTHADSLDIVMHLEKTRPKPSLFPNGDTAAYRFMHRYVQTILFPTMARIIVADIPGLLEGEDRDYFIESREKRFGKTLDEFCANREDTLETLNLQLDPFRKAMTDGDFISGAAPAMADYLLFGTLQWARIASTFKLVQDDDVIASWMEKMLDLHDGLGRTVPARS